MEFKGKRFGVYGSIAALALILLAPLAPWPAVIWLGEGIGLALLIVVGIVIWRHWRCPHCRIFMPIRGFYEPEYCPGCGKRMEPYE